MSECLVLLALRVLVGSEWSVTPASWVASTWSWTRAGCCFGLRPDGTLPLPRCLLTLLLIAVGWTWIPQDLFTTDATKTFRIQTLTAKIIDFSDSNLIWAILWVFEWQIIETSYENKVESTQFSDSNDVICKNILLQTIFIFKFKVLNIFRQFLSRNSVLCSFRYGTT